MSFGKTSVLTASVAALWLAAAVPAAAGITVDGRVVDAEGHGIRGAEVTLLQITSRYETAHRRLTDGEPAPPAARILSDPRGFFELSAPRPGMWKVSVTADGFVPVQLALLPWLDSTVLPEARLEPDAGLEIRVADRQGLPVAAHLAARWPGPAAAGMRLSELFQGRWQPDVRRATAGEDGRASLPRRSGEKLLIEVVAAGHAATEVEVDDASTVDVVLSGFARDLKVTDSRRRPLAGLLIVTPGDDQPLAVTDSRGRASLWLADDVADGTGTTVGFLGADGEAWTETLRPENEKQPDSEDENGNPVLEVALEDAILLTGRVLDAGDRRPIAGAWVWTAGDSGSFVDSAAGGGFTLARGPVHRVGGTDGLLLAAAPGYCRGMAQVPARGGAEMTIPIALAPAATAGGMVVDDRGEPVAGVAVSASLDGSSTSGAVQSASFGGWRSRTSARGRFRLSGLPAGERYELEFSKRGYSTTTLDVVDLISRDDLRVVLENGRRGVGVLITADGEPISGGEVRLRAAESPQLDFSPDLLLAAAEREDVYSTDGDGRFEIPDLSPGRYHLEAKAAGFAPVTVPGIEVHAETGAEIDLGTLVMVPGIGVEGRVADRDQQPLAGAEVRVVSQDPSRWMIELFTDDRRPADTSDAAGRFRVSDQRPGDVIALMVEKPGYSGKYLTSVTVADPPGVPLEVVLEELGRVSGRVSDGGGSPVAGAQVRFDLDTTTDAGGAYSVGYGSEEPGVSNDDGRFEVTGLAAGSGQLQVAADGFQKYYRSGLLVPAGGELTGVEVVLERGVAVAGRVTGPGGKPVADAWVRVLGPGDDGRIHGSSGTDADGRFHIDGVAPGLKSLTVHHGRYQSVTKEVELLAGRNTVVLELGGGVEVSGRVVDGSGLPLADVMVQLRRSPTFSSLPRAASRPDGVFIVENVPPGDYQVRATKDGYYLPPEAGSFKVESAPVAGLEIRLAAGTTLRGRILGVELDDLARVEVYARHPQGARHDGRVSLEGYKISGLRPGPWAVRALIPQAGKQASGEIEVAEGMPEAELDLEFRPGFAVAGIVVHRGEPVRGATVWLHGVDAHGGSPVTTGGDGGFRFENLDPGRYRIFAHGHVDTVQYREILDVDSDRELFIELESATRLAGFARDAVDLQPLAGVEVVLESRPGTDELEARDSASTDSRGFFSLEAVPEGPWKLTASKSGYAPATLTGEARIGNPADELELRLRPTEGISFEVFHRGDQPPFRVHAAVIDAAGDKISGGTYATTEGGRVRMTSVPDGGWELLVQAGDSASVRRWIVAPGPAGRIDLDAGGAIRLSVPALEGEIEARIDVTDPGGLPHRGVHWGGSVQSHWILRYGKAEITDLRPGSWSVRVTAADGRSWTAPVPVAAGETAEVVLD